MIKDIYHICPIYSSTDGQLGYFCVLAIVENAAMNIKMQILWLGTQKWDSYSTF